MIACAGCGSYLTEDVFCWPCRDRNRHLPLTTTDVAQLVLSSFRQIDWWARTGVLIPSVRQEHVRRDGGRLFAWPDALQAAAILELVNGGHTLPKIRTGLERLDRTRFVTADRLVFDRGELRLVSGRTRAPGTIVELGPLASDLDRRARAYRGDRTAADIEEEIRHAHA